MSEFSYTPKPWHVESGSVYASDGTPIAHMERDPNIARNIPPVERDRNAHLIATAPELLEKLQTLVHWLEDDYESEEFVTIVKRVIAKALQ